MGFKINPLIWNEFNRIAKGIKFNPLKSLGFDNIESGGGDGFQVTKSVLLNGTDEHLNIPVVAAIGSGITSTMTVSAWVKNTSSFGTGTHTIMAHNGSSVNQLKWLFGVSDSNPGKRPSAGLSSNGSTSGDFQISVDGNILGNWNFICLVYDGSLGQDDQIQMYVNGVLNIDSNSPPNNSIASLFNSTADLTIGVQDHDSPFNYFQGNLTEIGLFNNALSGAEITEAYNSGTPLNLQTHSQSANLVGYWRPESSTTDLVDVISGNNGVFNNMDGTNIVTDAP